MALEADPMLAISGLFALLRGKRVRGWNRLCLAATGHRDAYRTWIGSTERRGRNNSAPSLAPASIGAVILDGSASAQDAEKTLGSLRAAFGQAVRALPGNSSPASLPADAPDWLLPIRAGDRVAAALGGAIGVSLGSKKGLIYWDEDRLNGERRDPWLKPGWDPLLFSRYDGLVGSALIRRQAIGASVNSWWDAALQAGSKAGAMHVPGVLTSRSAAPAVRAYPARSPHSAFISVIIPTRDRADLLSRCLEGIRQTVIPDSCEIIIIDNGSVEPETADMLAQFKAAPGSRVQVLARPGPFNYAALMNDGVATATGELVCLLNNDVEPRSADWLQLMVGYAQEEDVGAVGARLLYPDGRVQHAGVALGIGGAAGHVEKGVANQTDGFAPWHAVDRTVSAVTAACLVVSREKYLAVGGMDAESFSVDFNDVDLCLRLAQRGWKTVYCARATLVHGESKSRGTVRSKAEAARFARELANLRRKWNTETCIDPWHHQAFRRHSERCILAL